MHLVDLYHGVCLREDVIIIVYEAMKHWGLGIFQPQRRSKIFVRKEWNSFCFILPVKHLETQDSVTSNTEYRKAIELHQ